jgi:hypothetical protein
MMYNYHTNIKNRVNMTNTLTTTITFYPEKYTPAMQPGSSINFDSIVLKSGENKVSTETLEALKKHPDFTFWTNQGAFVTVQEGVAGDEPMTFIVSPTPIPEAEIPKTETPETPETDAKPIPVVQTLTLNISGEQAFRVLIAPVSLTTPAPIVIPESKITPDMIIAEGRRLGILPQETTAPQVESTPEFTLSVEGISVAAPTDAVLAEGDRPVSEVPTAGVTDRINPIPPAKRR